MEKKVLTEKMLEEVKEISKKNKVDLDRAFDMFRSNSEQKKEKYKGSDGFDYTAEISDKDFGELHKAVIAFNNNRG